MGLGLGLEGWPRSLPTPLVCCVQGAFVAPWCQGALAPGSTEVLGVFVFLYLVRNLPQRRMPAAVLVPYCFFVFCCLRLSRCKHCGTRAQPVALRCLRPTWICLLYLLLIKA